MTLERKSPAPRANAGNRAERTYEKFIPTTDEKRPEDLAAGFIARVVMALAEMGRAFQ